MLVLLGVFTARFGGMAYVIMLIVIWGNLILQLTRQLRNFTLCIHSHVMYDNVSSLISVKLCKYNYAT